MMSEETNVSAPFIIEGPIESGKKSKGRGWYVLLLLLVLCSISMNVYQWFTYRHKIPVNESYSLRNIEKRDSLQQQLDDLRQKYSMLQPQNTWNEGVFFEVQLGAFENFNLDDYMSDLAELRQEKYDGKNKFLLGRFTDLNKALRFENDMKRIGVSGAFIVGRVDGKLVSKENAIKAVAELKK